MNQRVLTLIEVLIICGALIFILYLGGIFTPAPPTTLPTLPPVSTNTLTPNTGTPTTSNTPSLTNLLTPAPPTPTFPTRTTPSGLIAFESTRDGNSEIYVVEADGSNPRNLTHNPANDYWPSWSPTGKQIAFFSARTGWQELYIMNADGSDITQLSHTDKTGLVYQSPIHWSPDGKQILALRTQAWFTRTSTFPLLDLIQTDGSQTHTLMQDTYFWQPNWSPDGKHLAFTVADNAHNTCQIELAEITDELSNFQSLTPYCRSFAWSPDGSQLAIANGYVYILNLNDPEPMLVPDTFHAEGDITWSPDGRYILYLSNLSSSYHAIYADGSGPFPLKAAFGTAPLSWASDGQWIAYGDVKIDGQADIYIVNLFGDARALQLTDSGNNYTPVWQPVP